MSEILSVARYDEITNAAGGVISHGEALMRLHAHDAALRAALAEAQRELAACDDELENASCPPMTGESISERIARLAGIVSTTLRDEQTALEGKLTALARAESAERERDDVHEDSITNLARMHAANRELAIAKEQGRSLVASNTRFFEQARSAHEGRKAAERENATLRDGLLAWQNVSVDLGAKLKAAERALAEAREVLSSVAHEFRSENPTRRAILAFLAREAKPEGEKP